MYIFILRGHHTPCIHSNMHMNIDPNAHMHTHAFMYRRCIPTPQLGICSFISSSNYYIQVDERENSEVLLNEVAEINNNLSLSHTCTQFLLTTTCFYLYPDCDPEDGTQFTVRDEDCNLISFLALICQGIYTQLLLSYHNPSIEKFVQFIEQFRCRDPSTYVVPGVEPSRDKYTDLGNLRLLGKCLRTDWLVSYA